MSTRSQQLVALILALCLQAQALAAVFLPCAHESAPPVSSAMHSCHGGIADAGADGGEALDCEKCMLTMVLSVFDLPVLRFIPSQLGPLPTLAVTGEDHYYRYSPATPHRPPISPV